jgi:hypothetical protein
MADYYGKEKRKEDRIKHREAYIHITQDGMSTGQ